MRKKLQLLTLAMALSLAMPVTVALAVDTKPSSASVEVMSIPTYDEVYKLPGSAVTSITNNAGNYGNSVIKNAVDGNNATHWETNKPNNNTFQNKITITLDESYELNRLNYLVRQDGARPKGFPLSYKLYYSTSESRDDFKLLKEGSFSQASSSEVDITFSPTLMRRFQLEFVKVQGNWASAAELSLYKYDSLSEEMQGIFKDNTFSSLNDKYQDVNVLKALEEKVIGHPNQEKFMSMIKDAKTLAENPVAFDSKVFTVSQRGNVGAESNRTKTGALLSLDSTGYYVTPGETIKVYVEADPDAVMPQLAFGQIADDLNGWSRFHNLKPGLNIITAQTSDKMRPAAIYFSSGALSTQQAYAPKVRLEGGTKFPMYVHGKTSTAEFLQELETFLENVSYNDEDFANGNPNGYFYNIAEITSENNTISTTASGAYKEVKRILENGSNVENNMDAWEDMYISYARYSGFDLEDETSENFRPRGKFMSRVFTKGPYGWADWGYTGYNGGNSKTRDTGFFSSMIGAASSGGWAAYHEWGHIYENKVFQRGESTNNLFSLLMQDKYAHRNRMVAENRWESHFTNYHNTKQYPDDQLFYGAMVYQLEPIYGHDLYGKAAYIARTNPDNILNGCTNNNDRLAVCLSLAAEVDLTGHFDYYSEVVSNAAKEKVAHLPKPEVKTYYVNNKSFTKDAAAFSNPEVQSRISAKIGNGITLSIEIDESDNAVLCHEVYRDGEFLGVTYGNRFIDKTAEENVTYQYTAITYDRKLNPSLMSDVVEKNTSEPRIAVTGSVLVQKDSDFDPVSIISATDVNGNDISDRVVLENGSVDTSQKGEYPLTFTVSDENGNSTKIQAGVQVVDTITYLSDINASEATVGWGKLGLDKSPSGNQIATLQAGQYIPYVKGLGTHAESRIVYDLTDKEYDLFDAYIGIDKAMAGNKDASVAFEVWLDGNKVFTSPEMRSQTEAIHVQLDVTGAKQMELIAKKGENNWSDHAVWADAKLSSSNLSDKSILTDVVAFVQKMEDTSYQNPDLNHKEDRWESLLAVLAEAETCMEDKYATQDNVDLYVRLLTYYIEENGQTYVSGGDPISFKTKELPNEPEEKTTVPEEDASETAVPADDNVMPEEVVPEDTPIITGE